MITGNYVLEIKCINQHLNKHHFQIDGKYPIFIAIREILIPDVHSKKGRELMEKINGKNHIKFI